jgi:hypothetical protein
MTEPYYNDKNPRIDLGRRHDSNLMELYKQQRQKQQFVDNIRFLDHGSSRKYLPKILVTLLIAGLVLTTCTINKQDSNETYLARKQAEQLSPDLLGIDEPPIGL